MAPFDFLGGGGQTITQHSVLVPTGVETIQAWGPYWPLPEGHQELTVNKTMKEVRPKCAGPVRPEAVPSVHV